VEPWAQAAHETLASFGITTEALRVPALERPYFGQALRPLLMRATDVQIGPPVPDELSASGASRRTVRFALPRGAYATVLMRALAPATSI
jgi:tRNA(Glu) U13 pseudouridine synthase TruD